MNNKFKMFKEELELDLVNKNVVGEVQVEMVPEFYNEHREPHPKTFLDHLKMNLKQKRRKWEYKIASMRKYFKGESELWFEAHHREWEGFDEFKVSFLKRFWSEKKQEELRGRIMGGSKFMGHYRDVHNYVVRTYNQSQYLDPPMPIATFVRSIARQLPENLRLVLLAARPENLDTLENLIMGWQEDQKFNNRSEHRGFRYNGEQSYVRHDKYERYDRNREGMETIMSKVVIELIKAVVEGCIAMIIAQRE
ncbi:uncharacterized protein LOC142323760 [Lycorma delicatula]|uniref:uncharacterized protein LOC142323760 n=1 Tax=Lycorma delicatula TaxID=130591 RepID=UPI003F50F2E4